jgi:hypothetical protein
MSSSDNALSASGLVLTVVAIIFITGVAIAVVFLSFCRNGFGTTFVHALRNPLLGIAKLAAIFLLAVGWLIKSAVFKSNGYVTHL